jgi:PAS domain S-box-containing protein
MRSRTAEVTLSDAHRPALNGTMPPARPPGDDALRRSEARYRALVEASSQAVWSWSPKNGSGDFEGAMRWWEDLTGQPVAVQKRTDTAWLDMVHPDDHATAAAAWGTAITTGVPYDVEYRVRARAGGWRHVKARGIPIPGPDGTPLEWVGTLHDVTAQRQADATRRESEERLRLALEASGTGVWEWDIVTGRIAWSDQVHGFYGMRPGEFDGTLETFARHLHPADADRARAAIRASVEDDAPYRIEYRIVPKGGGVRWIFTAGRVIRDDAGRPLRMIGATSDVTERKRAEEALARVTAESDRRSRLYEAVLSTTPDLAYVWGLDHRFTYANEGLLRMWGKTWDEAIGKNCLELGYEPWHAAMHDREIEQVRATRQPLRGEVPFAGTFGRRIYDYLLVPVIGADGGVEAVAGITRDVTERKGMEQELRDQDRKKDDFIALLAHELRNPLAPIRNGLQVLRLGAGNPEATAKAREMMDRQLGHMVRLIDDLLDISRINRHKMELRRARVPLADVVASAVETARPTLDAAGHELTVALPATPLVLDADLTRLAQVFSNLLTNSAKYTPNGGRVWLSAERAGDQVRVSVRDTGIGIPAASLPTIFDMFSQVDRSVEKNAGGLGIGLALVKGLAEMHGGSVTAASGGEGRGSEFTVTLPVVAGAVGGEPDDAAPAAGPARRVLVVDDNRDGAESMAEMLRLLGHEVATAHDGLDAIAAAGAFRPDVVLMDVGMPRLNGLDATRRIREQPWGRAIAVVALTGWGQDGDRERSRAAGCAAHLIKPVDLAALQRVLSEVAG